ncbi:MAG: signal peptidase II [Chloroflexi bacterium]|nr:signal peptidase II [Chloroflexota bacterium]
MNPTWKKWITFVAVAVTVFTIDQIAKWRTVATLDVGETWEAFPPIFGIIQVTRTWNPGAAFGMFPAGSDFFMILAVITVAVFAAFYPTLQPEARFSRLGIAMICGGALSNAFDRFRFDGQVVDYVYVQLTPTFANISNFADHFITIGVVLLLLEQWRLDHLEAQRVAEQERLAQELYVAQAEPNAMWGFTVWPVESPAANGHLPTPLAADAPPVAGDLKQTPSQEMNRADDVVSS